VRKTTSPPYCFLQTAVPVRHRTFDKHLRPITVCRPYRLESWWPAKDLADLIRKAQFDIKRLGWKSDAKKGTVNGIPMRRIPSTTYQDEQFTAAELKAPPGYRYWTVDPKERTVTLLCMWQHDQDRMQQDPKLWKRVLDDPRYIAPMTVPLPKGWVLSYSKSRQPDKSIIKTPVVSGYLEDRLGKVHITFEAATAKLAEKLDHPDCSEVDDAFGWPQQEEIVNEVFRRRSARQNKGAQFWEITGKRLKNSPQVLYRAMHFFGATKLTELYKGHLVRLHHPQGLAFVEIGTWKCEMEIRLYVDKTRCQQIKSAAMVRAGAPGSQSDKVKAPAEAMDWYNLLLRLLETKAMIYSGNNFEV
jgi:hypothetical protein